MRRDGVGGSSQGVQQPLWPYISGSVGGGGGSRGVGQGKGNLHEVWVRLATRGEGWKVHLERTLYSCASSWICCMRLYLLRRNTSSCGKPQSLQEMAVILRIQSVELMKSIPLLGGVELTWCSAILEVVGQLGRAL